MGESIRFRACGVIKLEIQSKKFLRRANLNLIIASCNGFSYYYRFSDIEIYSVNPSFMRIGIFKWLHVVKYFFVHKFVLKAILVF